MEMIIDAFCPNCGQRIELHEEFSKTCAQGTCIRCEIEIVRTDKNKNHCYKQITLILRKREERSNIYD